MKIEKFQNMVKMQVFVMRIQMLKKMLKLGLALQIFNQIDLP